MLIVCLPILTLKEGSIDEFEVDLSIQYDNYFRIGILFEHILFDVSHYLMPRCAPLGAFSFITFNELLLLYVYVDKVKVFFGYSEVLELTKSNTKY